MAKLTYSEQLRHPNWQRKRLEVLESAGWQCENCGDKETTLNVHHKRYVKGRMAWEYAREELQAMCEPCHEAEHHDRDVLNRLLMDGSASQAVGLLGGYLRVASGIDPALAEEARQTDVLYFELGVAAACLEAGASMPWRQVIRSYAAGRDSSVVRSLIEDWDEKGGG